MNLRHSFYKRAASVLSALLLSLSSAMVVAQEPESRDITLPPITKGIKVDPGTSRKSYFQALGKANGFSVSFTSDLNDALKPTDSIEGDYSGDAESESGRYREMITLATAAPFYDLQILHLAELDETGQIMVTPKDGDFDLARNLLTSEETGADAKTIILPKKDFEKAKTTVAGMDGVHFFRGHPAIVKLIADVLAATKGGAPAKKPEDATPTLSTEVFFLKHAYADDITLELGETEKIVVSGVVSKLKKLVYFPGDEDEDLSRAHLFSDRGGISGRKDSVTVDDDNDKRAIRNVNEFNSQIEVPEKFESRDNRLVVTGPLEESSRPVGLSIDMVEGAIQRGSRSEIVEAFRGLRPADQDLLLQEVQTRLTENSDLRDKANMLYLQNDSTSSQKNGGNPDVATTSDAVDAKNAANSIRGDVEKVAQEKPLVLQNVKRAIYADEGRNAVVVFDFKGNIELYRRIIAELDRPQEMVEITVAMMDIDADASLDWQSNIFAAATGEFNDQAISGVGGFNGGFPNLTNAVETGTLASSLGTGAGLTASTLLVGSTYSIASRIKALETKGDARILSRPSVLTLDNAAAHFHDDLSFHVRVAGQEDSELFEVKAGTTVNVVPHIVSHPRVDKAGNELPEQESEKRIQLVVHICDGVDDFDKAVDGIPAVKSSVIRTQAIVGENQSLLIGGRYRHEEVRSEGRVPVVGRIPVVGLPFKNKAVSNRRFQRMFLISPRIIDPHQMHNTRTARALDVLTDGQPSSDDLSRFYHRHDSVVSEAGDGQHRADSHDLEVTPPLSGPLEVSTPDTTTEWQEENEAKILDGAKRPRPLSGIRNWLRSRKLDQ